MEQSGRLQSIRTKHGELDSIFVPVKELLPKYDGLPMFDGDFTSLVKQWQNASGVEFNYIIKEHYIEITYHPMDSEECMKIISGLILCGMRHIDIDKGNIRVYYDKVTGLIMHWN